MRAETTVAECTLTSCVWARFRIGYYTMPGPRHSRPTPTSGPMYCIYKDSDCERYLWYDELCVLRVSGQWQWALSVIWRTVCSACIRTMTMSVTCDLTNCVYCMYQDNDCERYLWYDELCVLRVSGQWQWALPVLWRTVCTACIRTMTVSVTCDLTNCVLTWPLPSWMGDWISEEFRTCIGLMIWYLFVLRWEHAFEGALKSSC